MEKTSSTYDTAVFDKATSPFAKRLQELVTNPSALKEYLGCSLQAINQYKMGTAFPKTENLIKIADYYGVSVDYLLGRTDVRSMDGNTQIAHKATGLSEEALNLLNSWKGSDDRRKNWPDYLSRIIEDKESAKLFGNLSDIMANAKLISMMNDENSIDDESRAASLWYISRNFSNIIERLFITQLDNYLQREYDKRSGNNGGNS